MDKVSMDIILLDFSGRARRIIGIVSTFVPVILEDGGNRVYVYDKIKSIKEDGNTFVYVEQGFYSIVEREPNKYYLV